jgi:protein-disulfide isomerase
MNAFGTRFLPLAALAALVMQLAACATPPAADRLDHIHEDVRALSTQVEQLSAQVKRIDRAVRPLETRRETVELSSAELMLGGAGARVGVVAFSDYQCPYCQRFHEETYPLLRERYVDTGKIVFAYRDLPLEFHPLAKEAAVAARCAGAQERYWEAADRLFESQQDLGIELYKSIAAEHGLDSAAYLSCLENPAVLAEVLDDAAAAADLGIQGTPTFFVGRIDGGRVVDAIPLVGIHPYEVMALVIDSLL